MGDNVSNSPCLKYLSEGHRQVLVHSYEEVSDPYQDKDGPSPNLLGDLVLCWGVNLMCKRCNEKSWKLVQEDEKYVASKE